MVWHKASTGPAPKPPVKEKKLSNRFKPPAQKRRSRALLGEWVWSRLRRKMAAPAIPSAGAGSVRKREGFVPKWGLNKAARHATRLPTAQAAAILEHVLSRAWGTIIGS